MSYSLKSSGLDGQILYSPSMNVQNVTKFVSTHTLENGTNSGSSSEHFLPVSPTEDERVSLKVAPSELKFATQQEVKSEGYPILDTTDSSQNVPTLNSIRISHTELSLTGSLEFSTGKRVSFELVETRQPIPSTTASSSLGSEPAYIAHTKANTVGWDSSLEQHSTSLQSGNPEPFNSSRSWQMLDVSKGELSSSVSISRSPRKSDTNTMASFVSITQAPDVHEPNTMAASDSFHGLADVSVSSKESTSTSQARDVSLAHLVALSLSPTRLSGVSEENITPVSNTPAPDVSCLFSISQTPDDSPNSMPASVSADRLADPSENANDSTVSIHIPDVTVAHSTNPSCRDETMNGMELFSTFQTPDISESSMATSVLLQWAAVDPEYSVSLVAESPAVSTLVPDAAAFTTSALVLERSSDISECATALSVSEQDPDISDTYSTAPSVYSGHSLTDPYSTGQTPDVFPYSMIAPSMEWLPDVSEYSTAASSVTNLIPGVSADSISILTTNEMVSVATSKTPDVSDAYSAAASRDSTQWLPEDWDYSTASFVTSWLAGNSKAETSMALPQAEQTTLREASSTELTSSGEYFSATSSPSSLDPTEALSSSHWGPGLIGKQFTLNETSYYDPFTSPPTNGIYKRPNISELQPVTRATTIGTNSGTSALTFELTENVSSFSLTGQNTTEIQTPLRLQFEILNRNYTNSLTDVSSEGYKVMETLVKGTLNAIFHARYGDSFLGIQVLGFRNGSVLVECAVMFQEENNLPTGSDIVRTMLTFIYHKDLIPIELVIDINSIACNGYSLSNLNPEMLLIEFTALSIGFGPWSNEQTFLPGVLQLLSRWVVTILEEEYVVQEFNIGTVLPVQGDVNIQGTALLSTPVHVDSVEVLMLLSDLVNSSVDLRSLKVNGSSMNLGALPISFKIENREYNTTLRDSRSAYFCALGKAVTEALQTILKPKYSHFVQAVIKHFGHGSVISTSELVFLNTPPASHEVLGVFFNLVNSNGFLTGTDFKVDAYSFTVGDARLDRPYKPTHFPGFAIVLIVLLGLAVVTLPVLAFLCWKYSLLTACREGQNWDVEQENTSLQLPLPEMNRESYRLHEVHANYSFES
ncbi:uncharacterized protein LOC134358523 isoform X3 [Mobula hypostoma]